MRRRAPHRLEVEHVRRNGVEVRRLSLRQPKSPSPDVRLRRAAQRPHVFDQYRDRLFPAQPDPAFPNYIDGPIPHGQRLAMPFVFRCGRLVVLMIESRGERDVFRKDYPILGARQWTFIDQVFARLPEDVDALAIVTPTPVLKDQAASTLALASINWLFIVVGFKCHC